MVFMLIMGYARSPFTDFENYLRIVTGLDENDIQLFLKQYNSEFYILRNTSSNLLN